MVDLRLLGPVEAVDEAGEGLELPGVRQRGLLALLALRTPNLVATDVIVETLWGDSDVKKPEAALHMAVSRLRTAIGEAYVTTQPGGYRLDVPVSNSDVNRFRTLVQRGRQLLTLGHPQRAIESFRHALAQWRGPALADVRDFEFAEEAARRLEEERIGAVELLMEAMLSAGEHDQAIGELFGLVEDHPLRERLWRLLMLALYRAGRPADALAAFKDLRSRLGEELGLEPSPELADLEERILLHDPALTAFSPNPEPLEADVEYVNFGPGDVIVGQGDPASAVYWIEEGRVEVLKADSAGQTHRLSELGPGRYFGELAAALGTRRTATVRALVPTVVSVHDPGSFRGRLGVEQTRTGSVDGAGEIWELVRSGEYLQAFDHAAELIETGELSPEIRFLAVLALARAGATAQARRRYEQYGLASIDLSTLSPQVAGDIAVVAARLDKSEALARPPGDDRTAWAIRSASGYAGAFESIGSPYHAVNAATMWLVAGNPEAAADLATRALESPDLQGDGYWDAVTQAEAALVIGDIDRAATALQTAADSGESRPSQRATTLKQLKLVCDLRGVDPAILAPIRNQTVVHYCGHRILPAGEQGRFPAEEEDRVRADLEEAFDAADAGFGFGSLAAGADILAAETLLERGAELHVVLPFGKDEFIRTSVVDAGGAWVERFERCLARAATVEIASTAEYLDDPVMFDYCARVAMGDAQLRAKVLETDAHQVAVWDGTPSSGVAGTAIDIQTWDATGAGRTIIEVTPGPPSGGGSGPDHRRRIRSVLFADFAGFSKLTDAQRVRFQEQVMKPLAARIETFRPEILAGNTWGDAIHLVFADVSSAAECSLELVAALDDIDMERAGLPQLRGLRVAAHAAPVFEGWDPIAGAHTYYGAGLTQAARIEPRTPEGEIYTTHAFAALAMLSSTDSFECQYVGTLPTAKDFGTMPLYALRRRVPVGV